MNSNDSETAREHASRIDRIVSGVVYRLHMYTIRLAREPFRDYPQTWYYVPHRPKWLRRAIQHACWRWCGHELSETEWGYGGGDMVDRWCRWCDELIQVPKEQADRQAPGPFRDVMGLAEDARR